MDEVWRPVAGYEGRYEVSNLGRVRSHLQSKRVIATQVDTDGYLFVKLLKGGERAQKYVHRLVALAFLEEVEGKRCVNHKNGAKTDNQVSNLEWVTNAENSRHAARLNLVARGERGNAKLTVGQVREIRRARQHHSAVEVARSFSVSVTTIRQIWGRKTWKQPYKLLRRNH